MSPVALVLALVTADPAQAQADAARSGAFRVTPKRPVAELRAEAMALAPPAERGPFHPVDLVATIYHSLGIDPHMEVLNDLKQPRALVEGTPALGLFA